MNRPIQTESRKKKHGDRRQHGNGAQDEMNEILSGQQQSAAPQFGNIETPELIVENTAPVKAPESELNVQPVLNERREIQAGDSWSLSGTVSVKPADLGYQSLGHISSEGASVTSVLGYVPPGPTTGQAVSPFQPEKTGVSAPIVQPLSPLEVTGVQPPFIATIGEPLAEMYAKPQEEVAAKVEEDPPMYYQEKLIIAITRHRAGADSVDQSVMRCMFSAYLDRISGLKTGFKVIPALGNNPAKLAKPQFEATASTVKLDYTERKGKFLAKFFEDWALDIGRLGLSDKTTIDFFVIEPSKDGKKVLDAWNCTGMHPYHMSAIEAESTYNTDRLSQMSQFEVTLNGNVRRGPVEVEAAQTLLDDLNMQLAAGA